MEGHSPLGASGAHRWMACPGSVLLSAGVEDRESDHASLGTAAHALAAWCLEGESDAWKWVGRDFGGIAADKDMADAVQVYLDAVRSAHPDRGQDNFWVERHFHCSEVHSMFYGTNDVGYWDATACTLHVWDYKHGVGVVVEAAWNPQLLYYAVGAMTGLGLWGAAEKVVVHVAQPRAVHPGGPVREWAIFADELAAWRDDVLVPAMYRAEGDTYLESGEHCRFCPVRDRCPRLLGDLEELEELMYGVKGAAPELSNEQVGRVLDLFATTSIFAKAARESGYERAVKGGKIPGYKLVRAKVNRTWKEEAEAAAKAKFGTRAYTVPELKSPAQIDKLPEGTEFTTQYALKPEGGLQLVAEQDNRATAGPGVQSMFKPQKAAKARKRPGKA